MYCQIYVYLCICNKCNKMHIQIKDCQILYVQNSGKIGYSKTNINQTGRLEINYMFVNTVVRQQMTRMRLSYNAYNDRPSFTPTTESFKKLFDERKCHRENLSSYLCVKQMKEGIQEGYVHERYCFVLTQFPFTTVHQLISRNVYTRYRNTLNNEI